IEFLESRYGAAEPAEVSGLQKWAERLEDGLRKRTVNPSNLREAFQLISAADRVLGSVAEAGREILGELAVAGTDPGAEPGPAARPTSSADERTDRPDPSGEDAPHSSTVG